MMKHVHFINPRFKSRNTSATPLEIFGCFASTGILGLSQQTFLSAAKHRARTTYKVDPAAGITADHLQRFVMEMIETLRNNGDGPFFVVMKDSPMYREKPLVDAIKKAGHKPF